MAKKLIEKWSKIEKIDNNLTKNIYTNIDSKKLLNSIIVWEKHPYFNIKFLNSRLDKFNFESYEDFKNNLDKDGTSKLSVYLRFWIISPRYLYNFVKNKSQTYILELAWREFWQHINYNFPFTKKIEFQENKRHIKWKHDKDLFEKWCNWETWYPVVDASMKQLLETNWMHGRARMIVASFLTKDLLIDWRWWEAFSKNIFWIMMKMLIFEIGNGQQVFEQIQNLFVFLILVYSQKNLIKILIL